MRPSFSPSHTAARLGALAAATVAACLFASPAQAAVRVCTGTLSGVIVDELVVPSGASCTLENVDVLGDVLVKSTGSLDAPSTTVHIGGSVDVRSDGSFVASTSSTMDTGGLLTVGGSIRAGAGSTLDIFTKNFSIAGAVRASGADSVVLAPVPWLGSSAAIGDLVTLLYTENVFVGGAEIDGNLRIVGSGNTFGVQVGGNEVNGSIVVINSSATDLPRPTEFAIFENTVTGSVQFSNNDTSGTIAPPLIGSNTIGGNLVCWANTPAPTNHRPGGPYPNAVAGSRVGQCSAL